MATIYVNGLSIHMNEIAYLTFNENSQNMTGPVVSICMLYETLKLIHETIGQVIEQHDAKLHELIRSQQNMN